MRRYENKEKSLSGGYMRLTIIGATGRTGKHLVVQALEAGYEVIPFVRNLSKLTITHERLTVVQGDATDPAAVERAIQDTDAVICVLNTSFVQDIAKTKPLTRITQNILKAMKKFGVRRLIITSAGIPQPNDLPDLRFSLMLGIGKLLMPPAVEDTINSAHIVQSSDIDWTIVRMAPTNATPTGQVNAGYVKRETKMFVSRADAAMFMLKELRENNWVRQAPVIFNI
jgi:nucleoside-diphosphate-sugar epimerase